MRQQIESAAHTTAGIHKVSQQDLAGIEVPILPIDLQKEIVCRVEGLFALAAAIERRVAAAPCQSMKKLVSKEYIDRWWLIAVVGNQVGSATAEFSS